MHRSCRDRHHLLLTSDAWKPQCLLAKLARASLHGGLMQIWHGQVTLPPGKQYDVLQVDRTSARGEKKIKEGDWKGFNTVNEEDDVHLII